MNNDEKRAEQLRQAAAGMTAIGDAFKQLGAAFLQGSREIGAVIAAIPRELPPIAPAAELPVAPLYPVWGEYDRAGRRGSEGHPEYKVRELWDGRETDAHYTFDPARADLMFKKTLEQAYGAELYRREAGGWELIKVAAALDNGGHA
jgi:hypothetical protein